MAAQPTKEAIDLMCNLTNISRSEAVSRLKGNNNDVTQASNEYFDNPGTNPYAWDETHFSSDRDGSNNKAGASFQVQGPDDHGTGGYLSSAPSRPPSRISNKSPLGRSVSLADRQQDGSSEVKLISNEYHDADLQRALAESAQEHGLPPQEYGVTNPNGVHFGPATREHYNYNDWQLIHKPNGSVPEARSHPDAEDRTRGDGAPAFLKPSLDGNRLASILTIYHEIPLAREIFLRREDVLPDYGHDSEWWGGKAIGRTREVRRSVGGGLSDGVASREGKEVFYELQRLVAFLDKTERSYGSAEPLANLGFVKRAPSNDLEGKFFEAWKYAQRDNPAISSIFSEAVQPTGDALADDVETSTKDFAILDLDLPNVNDSEEYSTLYDLTDRILWAHSGLDIGTSAYLTHVADIVGFRLLGNESSRSIAIPEIWFPDRYLEVGREAALDMRIQKAELRATMMKLQNLESMLKYFTLPGGKQLKVDDLFNISLMHNSEPIVEDVVNGVDPDRVDTDMNAEPRVSDKIDVSAELQKVIESINRKLDVLNQEKQNALASLHELSKLFTQDREDPNQPPLHKYKLCGVSTTKETTYLRKQAEPDLIDMELDATELKACGDQWWKIKYVMADAKPVTVMKVTLEDVLAAAMTESKASVVIYASERAMEEPVGPLPDSLEAFVRADNLAFSAEFPHNIEVQDSQSSVASPVSPGKRKYDESVEVSAEDPPRYTEQTRWGGTSPLHDDGVIISHQEVDGSDDGRSNGRDWPVSSHKSSSDSTAPRGSETHDIIMGQDPNELAGLTFDNPSKPKSLAPSREMQEKGGMTSLLSSTMNDTVNTPGATDSMDVDEISIEEAHIAGVQQVPISSLAVERKQ